MLPVLNRGLLQSMLASAVVLASAACSPADRAETGSDNSATMIQDTGSTASQSTAAADTATGAATAGTDTTMPAGENTGTGAAAGDTAPARIQSNAPRAATATPSAERQDAGISADSTPAGYRPMEQDTTSTPIESDSARVTEDTSETSSVNTSDTAAVETAAAALVTADTNNTQVTTTTQDTAADTSAAGYVEMARDTSSTADQIDTTTGAAAAVDTAGTIQASIDTARTETEMSAAADTAAEVTVAADVQDTTGNAGRVRPPEDSTEILGRVTTDTTTAFASADTTAGVAAVGARGADTTENAGRIRPPEDSTEVVGDVNAADTADEVPVTAQADANIPETEANNQETVARRETPTPETSTESTGAAAIGGTVTGSEAVALVTRHDARCSVVDPETNEEVRWDMSSTPVTLNPCGLGSMVLSKVWTEK